MIKKELLTVLKSRPGQWVSGESISMKSRVTRSAIWKHIRKLREEGYEILSSPKLGYRLLHSPEKPIPEEIQLALRTKTFGKTGLVYLPETDSTNRVAKDLAANHSPEGTVVIAEKQTKGRGRLGRQWFSPAENGIYISLILRPVIPPQEAPKLTLLTAVAVADAVTEITSLPVRIKWPNDILIRDKKAAGILTEISSETDLVNHIVVGLGVNVNTSEFPEEIRPAATSLFLETGRKISRVETARACLENFEKHYEIFKQRGFAPILQRWKEHSDMIGKSIGVAMLNERYCGVVRDIDPDGALVIQEPDGRLQRIICGDVTVLKGETS